jgi:hypothetical protein
MRLSCKKAFFLVAAVTVACEEPATAPSETASGSYILETINGRPLPTFVSAGQADTSFMLSATLTLDGAGNAVRTEQWRYVYPPNRTDEGTFIAHVQYRIIGERIIVGSFTPCLDTAACEGNKFGRITTTTLTLAYDHPTAPIFLYRLAGTD